MNFGQWFWFVFAGLIPLLLFGMYLARICDKVKSADTLSGQFTSAFICHVAAPIFLLLSWALMIACLSFQPQGNDIVFVGMLGTILALAALLAGVGIQQMRERKAASH